MIIDCHTHLNNYHDEQVYGLQEALQNLTVSLRRNRIDQALVLTSYKINPGRPSTADVVDATKDIGELHVVAGVSVDKTSPDDIEELRGFLTNRSICGLKIYQGYQPFFPTDSVMLPVVGLAEEFDVPLMIHTGDTYSPQGKLKYSHPLNIDELAVDHPDLKIIICHMGNPWIRDTMEVVYKNKNVYTDISGLVLGNFSDRFEGFMHKQIQEMIIYGVEPDKVLYGTDWPLATMESYVEFMEELRIPPRDKQKIMYLNSARLFKLDIGELSGKRHLGLW